MKGNSNIIRWSFSGLWTLGWVCVICLIASLSKEFKYRNNPIEETIQLSNPTVEKLEVKANSFGKYYRRNNWFQIEPFASLDEDTVFVRNVRIRIVKTKTDSFSVKMVKFSNGRSRQNANVLVSHINYNINQIDSTLLLEKGISITPQDKFRNQNVLITIAVPIGKRIVIKSNSGWDWSHNARVSFGNNNDFDNDWDSDDEVEQRWRHDVEYIMTKDGLKRTNQFSNSDDEDDYDSSDKLRNYKKSKEEVQKELEETERKANELKKELQTPMPADSSTYKYQPTKPSKQAAPVKNTAKEYSSNGNALISKDALMNAILPKDINTVLQKLQQLGLSKDIDKFTNTLTTAATQTATNSIPVFVDGIKKMSITDAIGIVKNGGTAATDYLRTSTGENLKNTVTPIMKTALDQYNITKEWDKLVGPAKLILGNKVNLNLNLDNLLAGVVTNAMFSKIAEQEVAIRTKAEARTSPTLQRVFGKTWN